jgi:hypothetical protein
MVFPKPAKACEGAMRRGETRVKGNRVIHSSDEEARFVRDEAEDKD